MPWLFSKKVIGKRRQVGMPDIHSGYGFAIGNVAALSNLLYGLLRFTMRSSRIYYEA
jgi:hypothetical protein